MNSILFTEGKIGPLTLRNRTIRSAAFESMCPGNRPSQELFDYHLSVAAGGVGMTTIAYAAVTQSGLSFERQLWMRPEIVLNFADLRTLSITKEQLPVSSLDIVATCLIAAFAVACPSVQAVGSTFILPLLSVDCEKMNFPHWPANMEMQ